MIPRHNVKRKPKRTVGLFLAGAKLAKVLLTVLSSIAEDTVDLFEIWGEEIVFKNVLVSGESVTDSGK